MRLLPTVLSLSIAVLLVGCGGSSSNSSPNDSANTTQAPSTESASSNKTITAEISGAGASFVYPLMSKWSADYNAATGGKVNYQSIGSGGGIAQIKAATVDFGSSDKPLSSEELATAGLAQFPSAIGGVVPVFQLEGIESGKLKLTGEILANIFLGNIKLWNDPAIAGLNPELKLPETKITLVHRSDGSGTTFNFTNYLSKVSPEWKTKIGEGTSVQWVDGLGGKGNEGVASYVQQVKGSLGYVELSYALQNKMPVASLQNAAGKWVQPNAESFAAAAANADWKNTKDFNLVITNAAGENSWPITATNFILMQKNPKDKEQNNKTQAFFKWAFEQGQAQASALDYVPLPAELVQQIEQYWQTELK